jgi:hypothetical protein
MPSTAEYTLGGETSQPLPQITDYQKMVVFFKPKGQETDAKVAAVTQAAHDRGLDVTLQETSPHAKETNEMIGELIIPSTMQAVVGGDGTLSDTLSEEARQGKYPLTLPGDDATKGDGFQQLYKSRPDLRASPWQLLEEGQSEVRRWYPLAVTTTESVKGWPDDEQQKAGRDLLEDKQQKEDGGWPDYTHQDFAWMYWSAGPSGKLACTANTQRYRESRWHDLPGGTFALERLVFMKALMTGKHFPVDDKQMFELMVSSGEQMAGGSVRFGAMAGRLLVPEAVTVAVPDRRRAIPAIGRLASGKPIGELLHQGDKLDFTIGATPRHPVYTERDGQDGLLTNRTHHTISIAEQFMPVLVPANSAPKAA